MLTPALRSQFIERLYTSETGEQFTVLILVHEVNGELKGRIVSVKPIHAFSNLNTSNTSIPCLPAYHSSKKYETIYYPSYAPIVSPYTELYFFYSQPTRAPSL